MPDRVGENPVDRVDIPVGAVAEPATKAATIGGSSEGRVLKVRFE